MVGKQVPTLKDVAERAQVHTATASRALNPGQAHLVNPETRLRVQSAAEALGYRGNAIAQSLRTGKTGTLGVVVADLANPYIVTVVRGIEFESRGSDYISLVAETHDGVGELRSVVTRLLRNRVDALIISAAKLTDEDFIAELESQVPVVLAVRGFDPPADGSASTRLQVLQDDDIGAGAAVNHLVGLGHRRIAQLPGPQTISSFVGRSRAYVAAIKAHPGVEDVSDGSVALESMAPEGRRLANSLMHLPPERRPTAIFAHNDLMAVGAIDALRDAGLECPTDVSVVGYNDVPLIDHLAPPLTTVRLPAFQLGRHCAILALGALAGETPTTPRIMIAPEFIQRKSTQAPPPSAP